MNVWWRIWALALCAKLVLAAQVPLTPDEAYYWVWGQNPSLSYYDHPPLIAWLMALGGELPDWAVRWPAIFMAHASLWFWSRLAAGWLDAKQQILFLILMLFMPLIGLLSIIATPDLPLLFSWSFSLWAGYALLSKGATAQRAVTLGAALGLGVLSKYHIVLMGPILFIAWWRQPNRPPLLKWLPLTALVALLVASPVWIWNIQHDWASFRFQLEHGLGRPAWKPKWTYEYVLAQLLLIFPTIIFLSIKSRAPLLARAAAWFPLLFFFSTSFRAYVEANWPLVAHPMLLALAVEQWPLARKALLGTLLLWAFLTFVVMVVVIWPGQNFGPKTKLHELQRFDELNAASQNLSPLYGRSYQMASTLSFKQKRVVAKLRGMNRRDFFDTLPASLPSQTRIYVAVERDDQLPAPWNSWIKTSVIPVDFKHEIWELQAP